MAEQAALAGLSITLDVPPPLPLLLLDSLWIEQALLNLIENAIAHTPPSGGVTVGATVDEKTVAL